MSDKVMVDRLTLNNLLTDWEARQAKWWAKADANQDTYALGVTAALGDCREELARALGLLEDDTVSETTLLGNRLPAEHWLRESLRASDVSGQAGKHE